MQLEDIMVEVIVKNAAFNKGPGNVVFDYQFLVKEHIDMQNALIQVQQI